MGGLRRQTTQKPFIIRAKVKTRRYDEERGCYVYDIDFRTRVPLTDRTVEVSRAFGLGVDKRAQR